MTHNLKIKNCFGLISRRKSVVFMACHLTLSQRLSSLRDDVIFWLGKFSSDTLLKFFCAIVARGNAVQKIFPPKVLVYI